jgi:hypothetical protein
MVEDASITGPSTRLGSSLDESGTGGNGITWLQPGSLSHYLVVTSTCSWTMRVVQAA